MKDTVARMLERQAHFVAGVEKEIAAAERGDLIDHEDEAHQPAIVDMYGNFPYT